MLNLINENVTLRHKILGYRKLTRSCVAYANDNSIVHGN